MRSTPHGHDAGFVLNHGNQHGNQIGMGNIIGYNGILSENAIERD
ncbi:hypothetical protein [Brucella sp. 10RB9213]|nr:hypothetical protein [Brucella sp. 10RB9213]